VYKKIIVVGICLGILGCGGLSYRIATCPKVKAVCSNSEMFEVKVPDKGRVSTSSTFVILVKAKQGKLDSLSATIMDQMQNKVVIDPSEIHRPGSHNIIDSSYWLVRFDWTELSNKGLRVKLGARVWTVILTGKQKGKTLSETQEFIISI